MEGLALRTVKMRRCCCSLRVAFIVGIIRRPIEDSVSEDLPGGGGGAWGEAFETRRRMSSSARWTTILSLLAAFCLARQLYVTLTGRES